MLELPNLKGILRERGVSKAILVLFCAVSLVVFVYFIVGSFLSDFVFMPVGKFCSQSFPYISACGNLTEIATSIVDLVVSFVVGGLSLKFLISKSYIFLWSTLMLTCVTCLLGGWCLKLHYGAHNQAK